MLPSKISELDFGKHLWKGINILHNHYVKPEIFGFDVETIKGKMYSMQFYGREKAEFILADSMSENDIIEKLFSLATPSKTTIFFAHNLPFDLGASLPDVCMSKTRGDLKINGEVYKYTIFYPQPAYLVLKHAKTRKKVVLMDTFPWFFTSLQKAGKMVGCIRKMKRPPYIGKRKPKKNEFGYFKTYAMIDAEIAYWLGMEICKMHYEYDINMNYSVRPSSLAAKIFKKHFMKRNIIMPSEEIINMALRSYWGGRVEAFGSGTFDVELYDYNSFYPYAMSKIKIPKEDSWIPVNSFEGLHGFYNISGVLPKMKVSPLPFKLTENGRLTFPVGRYDNIIVTGAECEKIMEHSTEFTVNNGFVYIGATSNSMRKYVKHFYQKKIDEKHPVKRGFNKLLLNSLYGKFIQMTKEKLEAVPTLNIENKQIVNNTRTKAGGLFNPMIASWITGQCRAELFQAMKDHEKDILYCDTDSLMVRKGCYMPTGNKLGDLKLEHSGKATIIREKLYVLTKGQKVVKYAKHGFLGKGEQLWEIIQSRKPTYKVERMIQLRESKRLKKRPQAFNMTWQKRNIKLQSSLKRTPTQMIDFTKEGMINEPLDIGDMY